MSKPAPLILQIAVPTPLRRTFDYLPPIDTPVSRCQIGCRVRVPFGRRQLIGYILAHASETTQPADTLKRVTAIVDDKPLLDTELLTLVEFVSRYYQHPIGDVIDTALPVLLRLGRPAYVAPPRHWRLTAAGYQHPLDHKRAAKQSALLAWLRQQPLPIDEDRIKAQFSGIGPVLKRLTERALIEQTDPTHDIAKHDRAAVNTAPPLSEEQQQVMHRLAAAAPGFNVFVLDGVTGSGKTEIYLQRCAEQIQHGRQSLILVPEIGLTPQLLQRFTSRLNVPIAVWHSALNDSERLQTWLAARNGQATVIIGTRSAVFLPVHKLGLIIVDEEHDASFKQQEGLRYSARDLAIWRARYHQLPIILGSATPSLETLNNAERNRYTRLILSQRVGTAQAPTIRIIDSRRQAMSAGLGSYLKQVMRQHLAHHNQVLLFLNRRGYAPTVLCHDCGWIAQCPRCNTHFTLHRHDQRLRCHHCGSEQAKPKTCPACLSEQLLDIGIGTERIENALREEFADTDIIRIDRDTTRRKGSLDALLDKIKQGQRQILIGTQMLAKGHHFPNVTLVGIVDADHGLHSADFRATERMAQLITQVSGRAGRADKPGEVLIQTHHPDHPLLQRLVAQGYRAFALAALAEREQAQLPPYTNMAVLRAESVHADAALQFLQHVADLQHRLADNAIQVYGPLPAPMEKRAGRYRAQLILVALQRHELQRHLQHLLAQIEAQRRSAKVRWSVDVDPIDTY